MARLKKRKKLIEPAYVEKIYKNGLSSDCRVHQLRKKNECVRTKEKIWYRRCEGREIFTQQKGSRGEDSPAA